MFGRELDSIQQTFKQLAKEHEIVIHDPEEAAFYAELFLEVSFSHRPSYLPSEEVALEVMACHPDCPSILINSLRQIRHPVATMTPTGDGFTGTAYAWSWWVGTVERVRLRVSRNGQVIATMDPLEVKQRRAN